jgi:hypothetical protein
MPAIFMKRLVCANTDFSTSLCPLQSDPPRLLLVLCASRDPDWSIAIFALDLAAVVCGDSA